MDMFAEGMKHMEGMYSTRALHMLPLEERLRGRLKWNELHWTLIKYLNKRGVLGCLGIYMDTHQ